MKSAGRWKIGASVALALCALGVVAPSHVGAQDAAASKPPPADPEKAAALARAEELNTRVDALFAKRKLAEATPLAREALGICEKACGADHPDILWSLRNLAGLLDAQCGCGEAVALYRRVLAIQEKALGKDDPELVQPLNALSSLLLKDGLYDQAHPFCVRALAIQEKAPEQYEPDLAASLSNLATLLQARGEFEHARPLFARALALREKVWGSESTDVAASRNNLALLLQLEGSYSEALPLFRGALEVREKVLGKEHPDVAQSLNNLAELLRAQGDYGEARPLYERALAIYEKARGKGHLDVATILNNLALLLQAEGAYGEAKPLLERALAIEELELGKEHPDVAVGLNNLAVLHQAQGALADAKPLYERALAIREKAFGKEHPRVAESLGNLAVLRQAQGDFAAARPLHERALAIREKAFGKDHPSTATSLNNLAEMLRLAGRFAEARPLHERALAVREKALGEQHPAVAQSLQHLAELCEGEGRHADAKPLLSRALDATERHARAQFSALDSRQRRELLRTTRHRLDAWIELVPHLDETGYDEVLRFKGLVGRAEAAERALSRRASAADLLLQEELRAAERRVARLANEVPSSFKQDLRARWQAEYAEAGADRERRTLELARRMAPFRAALERLDLRVKDVQAQLRPDVALIDFLRVKDRYLAWIVRAKGEPVRVDVDAADVVESSCADFVAALVEDEARTESAAIDETSHVMRAVVWAPIEAKLLADGRNEEVTSVVLCPDAALAAVPFAAIPGRGPGRYLLDEFRLSYVMDAQDLVPTKDAPPSGAGALLVGAVDYERAATGEGSAPLLETAPPLAALDRARKQGAFVPIPQTRVEVESLRERLGRRTSTALLGPGATEAQLRASVKGRRIIHIATHGFSREDLTAGLASRRLEDEWTSAGLERQLAAGHDPMLLSGLAMAGANPRDGGDGDDGILTALEASHLDLDGADLVTLSACETAKGTAESGEGVLGLVAGFQMAGARGVLASLWKVDDEGTRRLMEGAYAAMLRTKDPRAPADALRESAITLRDSTDADGKARFASPRYWAAFVSYGR